MRQKLLQVMCVLLLVASTALWAQTVVGTLTGKITTAQGTGVPNAAITVTNTTTNVSQNVLSGPDGTFTVTNLPPGTYRVEVETAGFKRTSVQNIVLTATGPATVNVTLEAGNINETVEIIGTTPVVQNRNADVSVGLPYRTVTELPVIDRNFQELANLQTGITPPETAIDLAFDPQRNRFYSTNGQLPVNNGYYIDGVVNQEFFRGTALRVQTVESIKQMNIETSVRTEDRGYHEAGATVTNPMRPGTNGWHGNAQEFWSGNIIRTRNFYNFTNNVPRFVNNQPGIAGGGPIKTDKTFIFGSWEGTYQNGDFDQVTTVPVAGVAGGNFSAIPGLTLFNPATGTVTGAGRTPFTGNVIPLGSINPTSAAIASFIPAPNLAGFVNNYQASVPFRNHGERVDAKLDQHFSDRTAAFARFGFSNWGAYQSSILGNVIGGTGTRDRLLSYNAILDGTHEFSPSLTTDFRFGYNRYDQALTPFVNQTPLAAALGPLGTSLTGTNLVGINVQGMAPIGASAVLPEHPVDNTFNWVWTWGWHKSKHDLKWGIDIRRIRSDRFNESPLGSILPQFGPNGTAIFEPGATLTAGGTGLAGSPFGSFYNSFAAFLLGAPTQIGSVTNFVEPTIRQTQYAGWVGDTFHPFHRLTVDLGVRYEAYSPLEPAHTGGLAFFDPATNSFSFAGVGGARDELTSWNTDSIAPRVGFAFRVDDKTVVRGGYAINYFQNPYFLSGFTAPQFGATAGVSGGFTTAPFTGTFGPTLTPSAPPPTSLVNGTSAGNLPAIVVNRHMDIPYVQEYSFQVQRQIIWDSMISVGYVGSVSRHLPFAEELNAAAPGTGIAGLPFLGLGRTASTDFLTSGLTSNYNSLQTSLSKRFAHGFMFQGAFTYSKALGYTSNNIALLNPTNLRADYGLLDFNRKYLLTIAHGWELPFGRHGSSLMKSLIGGWQINGIFTWATGTPVNVFADPLSCACPGNTVTASVVGSPYGTSSQILNPAAFFSPVNSFGTLGRDAVVAPGFRNYNFSLFKTFNYRDRMKFELRGEAYNLTNTPHFHTPDTNLTSASFGTVSASTINPFAITPNGEFGRQVNLALRILF